MKRAQNEENNWMSNKKQKSFDEKGVFISTSDLKKKKKGVLIPRWILKHSEVLDHLLDDEDNITYPAIGIEGVTQKSIEDCIFLYEMAKPLIEQNTTIKWKYYSENPVMEKVLKTVYRWRTRLGFLISTSGFFGMTLIQDLTEIVMKYRVYTSYSNDIKEILFMEYENKNERLLDFFVTKLKYHKIHFEMITSWITQNILNEWVEKMIFFNRRIGIVNRTIPYLSKELNFKPLFWRKLKVEWAKECSIRSLLYNQNEQVFHDLENLMSIICDYVDFLPKKSFVFFNDYGMFKIMWQISDEVFDKIIHNIIESDISFKLVPDTVHKKYFKELFNSDRGIIVMPIPRIISRWQTLLCALNAPEDSLLQILKFFPGHVRMCMNSYLFI